MKRRIEQKQELANIFNGIEKRIEVTEREAGQPYSQMHLLNEILYRWFDRLFEEFEMPEEEFYHWPPRKSTQK